MIDKPTLKHAIKDILTLNLKNSALKINLKELFSLNFLKWGIQTLRNTSSLTIKENTSKLINNSKTSIDFLQYYHNKYKFDTKIIKGILNIYWNEYEYNEGIKNNQIYLDNGIEIKFLKKKECILLDESLKDINFYGGLYFPNDLSMNTRGRNQLF
jgi:hypothetical protein